MELIFLGRGAGFNPDEGSTASYFIDNGEMFLIDSGESIFHTILNRKILDSVSKLNIMITHTHSDHVGSLGTLMLYAFAVKKIDVVVIIDGNMSFLPALRSLLEIYGLNDKMYRFADASDFSGKYSLFNKISYVKTKHVEELESCAIAFETDDGLVFYSGDINDPAPIIDILKSGSPIEKIYVDTNNDRWPNPHHISIHGLNDIIPPELKPKIYCMHLQNNKCIEEAQSYGFQVVELNGG